MVTSVAVTSGEGPSPPRPKVSTEAGVCDAMASTRASSAFRTATPSRGRASTNSRLATMIWSRPPMCSTWTGATASSTPTVGRAMEHSTSMWPWPRAPISTTDTSVSAAAFASVSGTPNSLLNEPSDAAVTNCSARTEASRSLALVLPTDPVIPTTRSGSRRRATPARRMRARATSGTTTEVVAGPGCSTRQAGDPSATATGTKSWPSRSPRTAANSWPGRSRRESMPTPSTVTSGPWSRPPRSAAR